MAFESVWASETIYKASYYSTTFFWIKRYFKYLKSGMPFLGVVFSVVVVFFGVGFFVVVVGLVVVGLGVGR